MNKTIKSCITTLAVAATLCSTASTSFAADYALLRVVKANSGDYSLGDKHLRLYENVKETNAGRDGWCSVPGDRAHRGSSWSCTVKDTSFPVPNSDVMGFVLKNFHDGDRMNVNGRMVTAYKKQPRPDWRPYCSHRGYFQQGATEGYHVYICAYFV